MDFDLRQWLLMLGPVFIAGVLLHGYWRMRNNRNGLRIALDESYASKPGEKVEVDDFSLLKAELPNGGARVIRKPEQTSLKLSEEVPMLMEPVATDEDQADSSTIDPHGSHHLDHSNQTRATHGQSVAADQGGAGKQEPITASDDDRLVGMSMTKPSSGSLAVSAPMDALRAADGQSVPVDAGTQRSAGQGLSPSVLRDLPDPLPEKAPPARASESVRTTDQQKPEKFMIVNVLAAGEPFNGQSLLEVLLGSNMTYGEMNIFHRLDDQGFSEFSLANAVEPGNFDLIRMAELETPGVTLFLRVHELADPLHAFEEMLGVADSIVDGLGGTLYDETRSVMTAQTIEHGRQSIRDFLYRHSA